MHYCPVSGCEPDWETDVADDEEEHIKEDNLQLRGIAGQAAAFCRRARGKMLEQRLVHSLSIPIQQRNAKGVAFMAGFGTNIPDTMPDTIAIGTPTTYAWHIFRIVETIL